MVYNDIWGWADSASGREYAIIGTLEETYFVEVTDPTNPIVRDSVPGRYPLCIHRDLKTYRNYCYGVADEGNNSTLQIIDMSPLPDSVRLVYDSSQFFIRAHNIFINEESGRLYACGTDTLNGGLVVLDIATNPEVPTSLGYFNLGAYTHDLYVRNDTVYNNNGWSGMAIWDMTNLSNPNPLGTLSGYPDPGYNHSNWVTDDGEYMVMCDETHNRPVRMVSVGNLNNPSIVTTFRSALNAPQDTKSIAHNPLINGDYACISYYHDGVQIYDISDPQNPVRAGYYDTDTTDTTYSGFDGCWGVYPFLPSGNIIASDVLHGLFVLRPGFVFPVPVSPSVITTGVCAGTQATGTATALPAGGIGPYTYQWSNGDTSVTTTGLSQGVPYTVTVTDRYGYTGVDTFNLGVNAPIVITDTITDESCTNTGDGGISIGITGGTPPYTVLWSTGDAIPNITGLTAGSYWVLVTDSAGCTHSDTFIVSSTGQTPIAEAGIDTSLCIANTILTGGAPSVGTGTWQILTGSAAINNVNDPNSVALSLGEGLNTLVWVAANGLCTDADTVNIYVSSAAYADAGVDTLACGTSHGLQASPPVNGQGLWSGPASVTFSNNNDPNSTIGNLTTGPITLTWTVTDSGCTGSDSVLLTVAPLPEADFIFSVNNLIVTFTDSSANASSWQWDFGDSTTSTVPSPTHTYTSPGIYQVCQTVSDTCGTNTYCQSVEITCQPPSAGFILADTLLTITLTDTSFSQFSNPVYNWSFGDGNNSTQADPVHTYATPGIYQVCLTVTDSCGTSTSCRVVQIGCPPPMASYAPAINSNVVTFNNTSFSADPNVAYWWDFGDGNTSTATSPTHTYLTPGIYLACVASTDLCGTDTSCLEFQIDIPVGLETANEGSFTYAPNPFSDLIQISFHEWATEQVTLELYDVRGKRLETREVWLTSGNGTLDWDLDHLSNGVYLISLPQPQGRKWIRVMKRE